MALALDLAERGEGVGRLTRLRDREQERAFIDRRVAVAELACVFHLDG